MTTLHEYQKPHVVALLSSLLKNGAAHDGSDTGTGKTYAAAGVIRALCVETLVVCPLSVVPTWEAVLAEFGCKHVTVMNYEKAWRRLGHVQPWGNGSYFAWDKEWALIVFDEVHRAGGKTTINSKMLIAAKRLGTRILTLSATVADTPLRMKAFGFALGLHDGKGYLDWLLKCGAKPGTFGGWVWKAKENEHIMRFLHEQLYGGLEGPGRGSRMRIVDIPDFPKTQIEVRLLPCIDRQVVRLSKDLKAWYDERAVKGYQSDSELAQLTYFRQSLETAKIPAVVDMIEDALETSRAIVFTNFNRTVDELIAVCKKRGWTYGVVRGEQSATVAGLRERTQFIADFQANKLDVMLCNIQAGGVGVSFHDPVTQVARTTIILPTFSSVALKQALGRSQRDGGGFSRQLLVYFSQGLEGAIAKIVRNKLNSLHLLNDAELCGDFRQTIHLTDES